MRRLSLLIAIAALLIPTAVFASGSSGAPSRVGGSDERAFSVTKNLKCTVIAVHENDIIRVRDDKSGEEHLIQLTERIPLKAQDKKAFGGRKKLQASDLQEGHRILVTKRTDVEAVVRIKVLKDRSKA